jgi:hypothetical protein
MALGLSSPLPCPPTARRPRCKGARNAGARDKPLPARPALAVAIPLSFAFTRRLGGVGANKKLGRCRGIRRPPAANGPAAMTLVGARAETVAAPFGAHANLQSIRSLNRSGQIDSDHSLDATEFLRRSFGPWTRTQTTRSFFKFSCSNGSTAPRTWRDFTSCRSNRRFSRIKRLCGVGVASGPWGASGSTCTRPGQLRRSSSRNGSIVRRAADTTSGTNSPVSGFRRTARSEGVAAWCRQLRSPAHMRQSEVLRQDPKGRRTAGLPSSSGVDENRSFRWPAPARSSLPPSIALGRSSSLG